ncbi:MAG: CvpA family protein [Rhodothermales bacterium]
MAASHDHAHDGHHTGWHALLRAKLMNSIDIIIALLLLVGLARGFRTGVIRQVAGLVGIILAFLLAIQLMGPLGNRLAADMEWSEGTAAILTFLIVFVTVYVVVFVAARLLEGVVGMLKLSLANRVAGAVLGGFKAALLTSIVLLGLTFFSFPGESDRNDSLLYGPVAGLALESWEFIASVQPSVGRIADEIDRRTRHLAPDDRR